MPDNCYFILAKGIKEGKDLKELTFVNKKPLIRDTQDKFSDSGAVYVITKDSEIAANSCDTILPDKDCTFTDMFETVLKYAKNDRQNIILFGHLLYPDIEVNKIKKFMGGLKVFGDTQSFNAISFISEPSTNKAIINLLNDYEG